MSVTSKFLEKMWAKIGELDNARLAEQHFPEGVRQVVDIPYADDGDRFHLLDVYYPSEKTDVLPVIIDVHGGGWTYGDKELNKYYAATLTEGGYAVVNGSYRLPPATDLEGQLRDCVAVCNWVADNASEYGFDLDNVFITGDSAGGQLAVSVAAISESGELQNRFGEVMKIRFRAVHSCCGALDFDRYEKMPPLYGYRKMLIGAGRNKSKLYDFMFPKRIIKDGKLPPLFMSTCYGDFIKSHTFSFKEFCDKEGLEYELYYVSKRLKNGKRQDEIFTPSGVAVVVSDSESSNKLDHVFEVKYPLWEESTAVRNAMFAFFDKHKKR